MNEKDDWYPEQSVEDSILEDYLKAGYTLMEAYRELWAMQDEAEKSMKEQTQKTNP